MPRYQKYHLKWPWTSRQVENLDEMLGEVYTDLSILSADVTTSAATPSVTTKLQTIIIEGETGDDKGDGQDIIIQNITGAVGPQGLIGPPGQDGEDIVNEWPISAGVAHGDIAQLGATNTFLRLQNILLPTEQLRLSYDAANYATFTTDATGILTMSGSAAGATLVWDKPASSLRPSANGGLLLGLTTHRWSANLTSLNTSLATTMEVGGIALHFTGAAPVIAYDGSGDLGLGFRESGTGIRRLDIITNGSNSTAIIAFKTLASDTETVRIDGLGNFGLGTTTFGTDSVKVMALKNGTAPSANVADCFHFYAADQTAGNSAPHFRTEAGDVIKLYKTGTYTPTNVSADRAFDANATSIDEIADVLGTLIADLQLTGLLA